MKDQAPGCVCQREMTEPRRRQFAAPSLRRWRHFRLRVRRSTPGCSWYAGKECEPPAPAHLRGQPMDQADCAWRAGSDRAKTRCAVKIRGDVAAEPVTGSTAA